MGYIQENRLLSIDTPLGKDVLLLEGFHGVEGMSRLFSFDLDLVSESPMISFEEIVGTNVTVSIDLIDGSQRRFNGVISRFAQGLSGEDAGGRSPVFSLSRDHGPLVLAANPDRGFPHLPETFGARHC